MKEKKGAWKQNNLYMMKSYDIFKSFDRMCVEAFFFS